VVEVLAGAGPHRQEEQSAGTDMTTKIGIGKGKRRRLIERHRNKITNDLVEVDGGGLIGVLDVGAGAVR
jgi:hypothetical protein